MDGPSGKRVGNASRDQEIGSDSPAYRRPRRRVPEGANEGIAIRGPFPAPGVQDPDGTEAGQDIWSDTSVLGRFLFDTLAGSVPGGHGTDPTGFGVDCTCELADVVVRATDEDPGNDTRQAGHSGGRSTCVTGRTDARTGPDRCPSDLGHPGSGMAG